jgi:hypothetical protein
MALQYQVVLTGLLKTGSEIRIGNSLYLGVPGPLVADFERFDLSFMLVLPSLVTVLPLLYPCGDPHPLAQTVMPRTGSSRSVHSRMYEYVFMCEATAQACRGRGVAGIRA